MEATKTKSNTQSTPSVPLSSEAESETIDNASKQGNTDAAPKSFRDLVLKASMLLTH